MGKGVVECGNDCISNSAFCTGQRTRIRASEIEAGEIETLTRGNAASGSERGLSVPRAAASVAYWSGILTVPGSLQLAALTRTRNRKPI